MFRSSYSYPKRVITFSSGVVYIVLVCVSWRVSLPLATSGRQSEEVHARFRTIFAEGRSFPSVRAALKRGSGRVGRGVENVGNRNSAIPGTDGSRQPSTLAGEMKNLVRGCINTHGRRTTQLAKRNINPSVPRRHSWRLPKTFFKLREKVCLDLKYSKAYIHIGD